MLNEEFLCDSQHLKTSEPVQQKDKAIPMQTKEDSPVKEGEMALKRTALNSPYRGVVERLAIPAELHARAGGQPYATFGDVIPIHCTPPEQVSQYAEETHHYAGLFTRAVLAPLGELAYVRLDDSCAEKVFINRSKRMLVLSSDGALACWRAAPTFESANEYVAGTPIVNKDGALVSLVTVKKGNHYAVSVLEGEGGYFDTPLPWQEQAVPAGQLVYGGRSFATRDQLREYVKGLPPPEVSAALAARAVLATAASPRIELVCASGRQLAHHVLPPTVIAGGVLYL